MTTTTDESIITRHSYGARARARVELQIVNAIIARAAELGYTLRVFDGAEEYGRPGSYDVKTAVFDLDRCCVDVADKYGVDVGDDCWTQASDWLTAMAPTFPAFGCDKHDLAIEWEDGEVYRGRMDCTATGSLDVAHHVRTEAEFVAGLYRPAWMTDGQWELCCSRHELKRDEVRSFLDTYQIGD